MLRLYNVAYTTSWGCLMSDDELRSILINFGIRPTRQRVSLIDLLLESEEATSHHQVRREACSRRSSSDLAGNDPQKLACIRTIRIDEQLRHDGIQRNPFLA